jgi:RimK family alpha-L-glutamate ligase
MTVSDIIIFSDNTGWHEERLLRALAQRNANARVISLRDCGIGHGAGPGGLHIPGCRGSDLPDGALVRAMPDGTFEQVSLRLDLLHALEEAGVEVYNPARAIERTVDKAMTSHLLLRSGIPTPATWVCESEAAAQQIVREQLAGGHRLVLKPLFGNCGRGLILVDRADGLPAAEAMEGVFYLQRYVPQEQDGGRDWRIFVIHGRAVAAMERVSSHWITNRARGGQCLPAVLTDELRQLAERAAQATDTHYTGVDIIRDQAGQFLVLEVNGVPAWRGLQSVHPVEIADLLAEDLLLRIHGRGRDPAAANQAVLR